MCLAVPMQVVEINGLAKELVISPTAMVELEGLRQEVRLDIVDRWPEPGDYVIVHAGFAIHTLSAEDAEINIDLMRQMAEEIDG